MMVLVDTPIWSLALRRHPQDLNEHEERLTQVFAELIREGRAQILGPIRQELLSGIREDSPFRRLRTQLRAFDEPPIEVTDYEEAASMNNRCRARGIAGSAIDFLICAVALRRAWLIFTTDRDFQHYASVLPLRLFAASV
jgi:predicted nucleic acid-binding protein